MVHKSRNVVIVDMSQVNQKKHIFCHTKHGVFLQRLENFDTKIIVIGVLFCAFKALEYKLLQNVFETVRLTHSAGAAHNRKHLTAFCKVLIIVDA